MDGVGGSKCLDPVVQPFMRGLTKDIGGFKVGPCSPDVYARFDEWSWRRPYLLAFPLVGSSVCVRARKYKVTTDQEIPIKK